MSFFRVLVVLVVLEMLDLLEIDAVFAANLSISSLPLPLQRRVNRPSALPFSL